MKEISEDHRFRRKTQIRSVAQIFCIIHFEGIENTCLVKIFTALYDYSY